MTLLWFPVLRICAGPTEAAGVTWEALSRKDGSGLVEPGLGLSLGSEAFPVPAPNMTSHPQVSHIQLSHTPGH